MKAVHLLTICLPIMLLSLIGCSGGGDINNNDNGDAASPKSWGAPELIDNGVSDYSEYPTIGIATDGSAIAVWFQYDENMLNIWASQFDGNVWKDSEPINSANGRVAEKPRVAVAGDGHAIAIWEQSDNTRTRIWANQFDGNLWGSPKIIDVNADSHSSDAQIAIASDGSAIAVWKQSDGSRYNIWANCFDGTDWGSAERIGRNDLGYSYSPEIAMTTDGSGLAVWFQTDEFSNKIWANRFVNSVWDTAELVEYNDSEQAGYPHVTLANNGNAIVVWQQSAEIERYKIYANQFASDSWGTPERIESNDADDAEIFGVYPRVAFAGDGTAIAVWKQSDGIRDNIWANRFDGTAWGTAELIENSDAGDAVNPQIAVADTGSAIAIWQQSNENIFSIWANRFDGTTWGTAELIENSDAGDAAFPQIVITGDGDAIAIWHQNDGNRWGIWSNRFE